MSKEKIRKKVIQKTNCGALYRKLKYTTKRYLQSVICEEKIIQLKKLKSSQARIKTNQRNSGRFRTEIKTMSPSKYFGRIV